MPFRFFALLLLSALVQPTVWSQTAATQAERPSEQVDKLFEKMDRTISPGCAVAAMRDGKILYQRGYSMADLDHNVPITADTVFHVASMSKQFTAAAIVMLAQERKLSLDDEVRKYVPELPDFGAPLPSANLSITPAACATSGSCLAWQAGAIPSTSSPMTTCSRSCPGRKT